MVEMAVIVSVLARENKMESDTEACFLIASQCNGLPSEAASLLKKMISYGDVISKGRLTLDMARDGIARYGRPKSIEYPVDLALRLSDMSGVEFEEYVGELFEGMGYNVEHTKATGDRGIDLVMRKGNEHIAVQCKRWSSPVGEPVVRDFFGALVHSGAKLGLIVTTTVFTPQAKSFAEGKPIHLIDLDRLMEISRKSTPIKRNNDIPPSPAPLL